MNKINWEFHDEFKTEFMKLIKEGSLGSMIEEQIRFILWQAEANLLRDKLDRRNQ